MILNLANQIVGLSNPYLHPIGQITGVTSLHLPAVGLSKKYGCDSGPLPATFSAWMVTLYLLRGLISVSSTMGTVGSLTGMVVCPAQVSLVVSMMRIQ